MAYKKPPIKANLHSADKALSLSDLNVLNGSYNDAKWKAEKRQREIDDYNFGKVFEIDPHFEDIRLNGNALIVRLFKENYIKDMKIVEGGDVVYDAWLTQVDGRMKRAESAKWVDNPLPYVFAGVVVCVSPVVENMKVGDVVTLSHFMIADSRYYKNPQVRDFIKNPEEYRVEHFEGYVKISPVQVNAIIEKKERFMKDLSIFKAYEDGKKEGSSNV